MTSFIPLILVLSLASSRVFSMPAGAENGDEGEVIENELEDSEAPPPGAMAAIEAANARLGYLRGGPRIVHGDVAQSLANRNADPCVATGCTWPERNGFIYVPVYISRRYSPTERRVIIQSLVKFHSVSCIRFVWRYTQRDYLYFFSSTGCWSYIGRQGGRQRVSLKQKGCLYNEVIQHEILHALGFHHEQARSDRDKFVQIVTENIKPANIRNFAKVQTNNLGTPYDYSSIMHYSRFAFSKRYGVLPTIIPTPNSTVVIGESTEMSSNDIERLNRLYQCSAYLTS